MGGMHTWVWGEEHPDFMDALLPLAACLTQISGRDRVWRRTMMVPFATTQLGRMVIINRKPKSLRTASA